MISRNLPPVASANYAAPAAHPGYPGAESEITPDVIELGSQLGCPFLASLKKPEFASGQEEGCSGAKLSRSSTAAAASAAVAGGFGMAAVAGSCPHMKKNENTDNA